MEMKLRKVHFRVIRSGFLAPACGVKSAIRPHTTYILFDVTCCRCGHTLAFEHAMIGIKA